MSMENILLKKLKDKPKVVFGLGFFDCVHVGHRSIVNACVKYAKENGVSSAIMSFDDNPKTNNKLIYSSNQRFELFDELGVNYVVSFAFQDVKSLSPQEYLAKCAEYVEITAIICGNDFKFGKDALGNVNWLKEYCKQNKIKFEVVDEVQINGDKVSTSLIRQKLDSGDIQSANIMLGKNYHLQGHVVRGKGLGGKMIVPTINITPDETRQQPKDGVYGTYCLLGDKWHKSVTNVGGQPTVGSNESITETHIIDYTGDLYDTDVVVRFDKRLRDIKKFDNIEELKKQIMIDTQW